MKIKQVLLILLLIGLISSLSAVSAQDLNATAECSDSFQSPQTSIYDAIDEAGENDVINLENGTYSGYDNTEITIDKSVSIVGSDNTVIDGENRNYIFRIEDNVNVTFENIIFANAYKRGDDGQDVFGSALEINKANVIIKNCSFISNSIGFGDGDLIYGGAISNLGNLTIIDSYFFNNSINSNQDHGGFGGAIYNNGNLNVTNSSFIASRGATYSKGAAIYNDGLAVINNSIIADTYSKEESMGSAIFNNGYFTLLNSIIENNTIERNNFNFIYGNIFNSGFLTAIGNIFKNNTAYYQQPNSGYEGSPTIYNVGGLNLSYNAFIDNVGGFKKIFTDIYLNGGNEIYINNNWWNGNENPYMNQKINVDKVTSWIILDVTPQYSTLDINKTADIVASWKTNNKEKSDFSLPLEVIFTTGFNQTQKEVLDGESTFIFNNTQNKGLYEVNVTVNSFTQTVLVDVGKDFSYLAVNAKSEIYPNEILIVDISLFDVNSKPINGNVTVCLNDQKRVVKLENGKAKTVFSKLIPDDYVLSLTYDGNDNYYKAFNQTNVVVKKYSVDLSIDNLSEMKVAQDVPVDIRLGTAACEGPANVYINGEFKNKIYLALGLNTIFFSNFKEGQYNITVEILGDEYYQRTSASTFLNVSKYDVSLNLACDDITVGENATLNINSENDFKGQVILSINGYNNTLFLENKLNEFVLSNLSAGIYHVDLIFDGNDMYTPFNTSTSFEVLKLPSDLSVDIKNGILSAVVKPDNCTGFITLHINQKQFMQNLTDGKADFTITLENGTNYIYVIYSGNDYYNQSVWNTTIGEGKACALIASNIVGWEYNNFTYSVQLFEENGMAMPNRMVSIDFNSIKYDVKTNGEGIAVLNLCLEMGNYTIVSTYGDLIAKSNITINPVVLNLNQVNVAYGEDVVVEAMFDKNVTGSVNFTLSNGFTEISNISDGKAALTVKNLGCGIYKVNAYYFNDLIKLNGVESTLNVDKLDSKFDINISEASIGQEEVISIETYNLTGKMKIIVDGDEYLLNITNNYVNLTLPNLAPGRHRMAVSYLGDEYHKDTTVYRNFTIKSSKTDILLMINDTGYMQDVVVVAKVDSNATGSISFSLNDLKATSQIRDGIAVWNFTGLDVGEYTVCANYLGDDEFISTANSTSFNVIKARSFVEVFVKEAFLDENIRIYAKVSPNATGKVSFSMRDYYSQRYKVISDSIASWLISPLECGEYIIYATYTGDKNYYSSSTEYVLKISQSRSYISVDANDVSNIDRVTIKVKLVSDKNESLSGNVSIRLNGNDYGVNVDGGEGFLVLGKLPAGNYTVTAFYEGSDKYSRSSSTSSFRVWDSLIGSKISVSDVTKYYNSNVKFTISLITANDKPISDSKIFVSINGVEKSYTTDHEGKVYLDTDYPLGKYVVKLRYEGSNSFYPSQANATIEVLSTIDSSDLVKLYGSGLQYFALFKDLDGKALMDTQVFFKLDGKTYNFTTLPNGVVRLNINLSPGTYSITAINPVTGENRINKITIFQKIMGNKDVVNYYGAKTVFKVRAYGIDGKPVGAGNVVSFKIGGKTFKVKTDKDGYAKLSIRLNPREFIVTTKFNGTKVYNKILVKPVLTTKVTSNKKTKKTRFTAKLVNTQGKPLKGKKITFKISNKKYVAKTNKKGIASVNVKLILKKGTYNLYTVYGKSKAINKINVK